MASRIVDVSELTAELASLMAHLEVDGVPIHVTQDGKPKAVLVRYQDYEAMTKKIDRLEDESAMYDLSNAREEAVLLPDY